MSNLTIEVANESELLELVKKIKLKDKLIAERKTIASNIKEKGRASCFISFFAHGFSRDLCDEQGDDTVGQLLQAASNKESEFILDKVYDSAISDLEIFISEHIVETSSLIERDIAKEPLEVDLSSELTGSDYFYSNITSALLESGSKLVVCFVSNLSESDALSEKHIEVILGLDVEFNDSDDYGWQYAVPINNQGEPLTAAEAGL